MCGEKGGGCTDANLVAGSPPHVRGKVIVIALPQCEIRITPACAGKRPGGRGNQSANKDHPRMCGEKKDAKSSTSANKGSPPHVRGKVYWL